MTLQASDWDLPDPPRFLALTPVSHASGVIVPTVLLKGGYVRLTAAFDTAKFVNIVRSERITLTFLVPTMIYALLDDPRVLRADLATLQTVVYGAAPIATYRLIAAIERFGPVFMQLYGQTEAPMCITTLRKSDHDLSRPDRLASCGMASPLVQVRLFDREMREVPLGTAGEVCVRSPLVMDGYWRRTEATNEAFFGGWLHTGDVAIRSADGYFTLVDRTKDMIISGGFNIYPSEVEDALLSHPAVALAAVIGVADDKWGEAVVAYVVGRNGHGIDAAALKAHVKERRGSILAPKAIHFVQSIPLTALGKIDRKAVRALHTGTKVVADTHAQ
jgi:fatty-acyl-CoA synthase